MSDDSLQSGSITALLRRADDGDEHAVEELFAEVYDQLRGLARRQIRHRQDRDLLQTTAIVNEACLRISKDGFAMSLENRRHLFAAVCQAVKRVLIDYARRRQAQKRTPEPDGPLAATIRRYEEACDGQLLDLQDALDALRAQDGRTADVIEARFWGCLSIAETAELLNISTDTVKRDWRFGRAFLHARLHN